MDYISAHFWLLSHRRSIPSDRTSHNRRLGWEQDRYGDCGVRMVHQRCIPYPQCHRGIYSYLPAQGFRDPQTDFLQFHSIWVPVENVCGVLDTQLSKKTIIATLVTDLVLLFTMLFGLLRLRRHGTMFGLGQLLWNQGLVWLFAATVAEVPPAVFLIVNLNDPFNLMFLLPAIIVMSIAATRMHRSLSDYAHSSGSSFDTYPTRRGHTSNSDPRTLTTPIPLDRVEVAVHTSSQDYPLTKVDSYGPYDSKSQLQDKAPGLGNGSDLEHEAERG
jgi:hypothetical protein